MMRKRIELLVLVLTLAGLITGCSGGQVGSTNTIAEAEESPIVALSFEPLIFQDNAAGIRLFYPEDWVVISRQSEGDRGAQAALLSAGSTLNQLAEGGTRLFLLYYQWDPKGDLEAYLTQRNLAWEASGFQVIDEEELSLADGRKVVIYTVKTAENTKFLSAFMVAGEEYLEINSDGNLDLALEIIHTITVSE